MPPASFNFPRSSVLVLGRNALHALVPSTLISQVESLLESHKIEAAADLANQQRKRVQSNLRVDEDQADELRYVYQRIGFQCFSDTLFEDAGNHFTNGELDPRLLVSYYPDLRGNLFSEEDELDVYSGVSQYLPRDNSVEEIVRNYSPHMSPNTREAPPTAELRRILIMAAREMLLSFLRKCRARFAVDGRRDKVVDTVLVKLFCEFEKTPELYALLQEPHDVVLAEVEEALTKGGQYNALCMLYKQHGETEKLLDALSKVVDGEWIDEDIQDPTSEIVSILTEKKDRGLTQKWAVWLTKRDPERGLKLLTHPGSKRRERPQNDEALLAQIESASPAAAAQFLEHLILSKRSSSRALHSRYATTCVRQLVSYLSDDGVTKLWRAKAASYASGRSEATASYLVYFANTTPDSESKRARLKAALFLQGSGLYDVHEAINMLKEGAGEDGGLLKVETAILNGKLGKHREALHILVHDLHDSISAEAYCLLGGEVIPAKVAQSISESTSGLQSYAQLWSAKPTATDEKLKQELLKTLLEVYMADDRSVGAERAARLMDSQAVNLDSIDVIPLVPPQWPLHLMSSFLTRSFRRTLHQQREGQIIKTLSSGQNLQVKEKTWLILREEGMVVEEAADEDDEEKGVGPEELDEKQSVRVVDISTSPMDKEVRIRPPEGEMGLT